MSTPHPPSRQNPRADPFRVPFRVALVGVGRMSKGHIRAVQAVDRLRLVAVSDANPAALENPELPDGLARYGDFEALMQAELPDIVVIVTPDTSHAPLTLRAARFKPRAIVCEKPMSTHYGDAVAMVAACAAVGVELLVNHQRRLQAGAAGRAAIAAGLVGDLLEVEARCGGQFISDGTHAVDLVQCLCGDESPRAVHGMVAFAAKDGVVESRYGHAADSAACAVWMSPGKVRCTVATGELATRYPYLHAVARGTAGELWHPGGEMQPYWFLNDGKPGTHRVAFDEHRWFALPQPHPDGGPWRCLNPEAGENPMITSLRLLAARLDGATANGHPLDGRLALRVQEIINATYLSALHHQPVTLPLPADTPFVIDELLNQSNLRCTPQ